MENKDMNVNLTHKTEIEVVSPVKLFLTRLLNVAQTILIVLFSGGGFVAMLHALSTRPEQLAEQAAAGLAFFIVSPMVIVIVRKTIDYLFNLGKK